MLAAMLTAQRKHENTSLVIVSKTWFRFAGTMPPNAVNQTVRRTAVSAAGTTTYER